jgi:hypothetical protein
MGEAMLPATRLAPTKVLSRTMMNMLRMVIGLNRVRRVESLMSKNATLNPGQVTWC